MTKTTPRITPRSQDFSAWYQDVIKEADLAEHSSVRGCMIIKPWGYSLWESIQKTLDTMIKDTGHDNVYFPLLIPLKLLEKEAQHVEGFAKECAVVTHYRLEADAQGKLVPSPDAELEEPLIIRPTSETVIGEAMAKWVNSYKDLPMLLNQWCNVMRWEMRTRLFLRTSEFLWQEGHTAHATQEEAVEESLKMLDVYETLARDYLAIPVIKGEKTAGERFPGATSTYTIEAMMQDGKALQAGTSHFLGQNFSKAYNIRFNDHQQQLCHAWTTSWGVTTRLIGAMIMVHSDDEGLVLPPRIASQQVILIPVIKDDSDGPAILEYCETLATRIRQETSHQEKIRVKVDKSQKQSTDKFWESVRKGIPLRLEIGKREVETSTVTLSRRDKPTKQRTPLTQTELLSHIGGWLEEIQTGCLERARTFRDQHSQDIKTLDELEEMFSNKEDSITGFAYAHFDPEREEDMAETLQRLKLTLRCLPFGAQDQEGICLFSGVKTKHKVIFAKSY